MKRLSDNARAHVGETITIRWGTSRGRDTYGYTTCSLRDGSGRRVAACNGGGYDMRGTVVGHWIARTFRAELCGLKVQAFPERDGVREFYGLSFHDPNYDPGKAIVGKDCADRTLSGKSEGQTVEEREKAGDSLGLERYQAIYAASSPVPTRRQTVPSIDGACGISCVMQILQSLGLDLISVHRSAALDVYRVAELGK